MASTDHGQAIDADGLAIGDRTPIHARDLPEMAHDLAPTWPHGLPPFHPRHEWELYAMWTFVGLFFLEFFALRGAAGERADALGAGVAFAVIGMGAAGSVLAGAWADRLGRERVAVWAMATSGACALVIGWTLRAPAVVAVAIALVWGFAVVAGSAQSSALVTEAAPPHAVGTALTPQTALGFLLTRVTISAVQPLRDAGGWPLAFGVLARRPCAGIAAMRRLKRERIQPDRDRRRRGRRRGHRQSGRAVAPLPSPARSTGAPECQVVRSAGPARYSHGIVRMRSVRVLTCPSTVKPRFKRAAPIASS